VCVHITQSNPATTTTTTTTTTTMTAVSDSLIFGDILSTRESAAIWSDTTRTRYYLEFESALATAQAQLKIIPQRAADEIVKHCRIEEIDWDELRQQTELIGYPVLPVVKQLVKHVNASEPGLGEWAHWGATTQVCEPALLHSTHTYAAAARSKSPK
jgi:3-carboxy-cis,cis-muconate cycloisomerase